MIVRTPLLAIISEGAHEARPHIDHVASGHGGIVDHAAILYPARLACAWIALRWRTTLSLSSPTFEAELVLVYPIAGFRWRFS
ncbi:hypothetical protein [Bradyrhizobium sp. 76]|jgi:hypothetical protein|uniref:hypothetical protein n=1 Tax=Bradyrhizobium sp. 76 TaxID=2782680 RepID=UPI001FFBBDF9|nr:hypothetical protein [Bradyrhizobium sp. 76]MCK1406784.1 hypothetical protein [Bradyrhizobium sp. 76]